MNCEIAILPEAIEDIADAADWYESKVPGLGADFIRVIRPAIASLAQRALFHRIRHRHLRIRWICTRRFPYRVVYKVEGSMVYVVAVLHAARHDREWQKRA